MWIFSEHFFWRTSTNSCFSKAWWADFKLFPQLFKTRGIGNLICQLLLEGYEITNNKKLSIQIKSCYQTIFKCTPTKYLKERQKIKQIEKCDDFLNGKSYFLSMKSMSNIKIFGNKRLIKAYYVKFLWGWSEALSRHCKQIA